MQILLNGERLDIQLEDENSLGEILHSVNDWLKSGGQPVQGSAPEWKAHYLTEFVVDGERFQVSEPWNYFSQKPSEINTLELFSEVDQGNILLESLHSLRNYFDTALQALNKRNFSFLGKLFHETDSLLELFSRSILAAERHLELVNSEIVENPLEKELENPLIEELKVCLDLWDNFQQYSAKKLDAEPLEEATELARATFQDAFLLLDELYKDCAASSTIDIDNIVANLEQKGNELTAALSQLHHDSGVKQSLNCISQISRLLEQLLQHEAVRDTLSGLFIQIEPFLQQLGRAIEEMDMINISDLTEYEIMPLIKQIVSSLRR